MTAIEPTNYHVPAPHRGLSNATSSPAAQEAFLQALLTASEEISAALGFSK
ncbi:hypothetical protein [Pseudomonas huaxiensis]|uniref:hypothetical protein n=1 Tax=Pseudomonas huaxiensis TaxID=2213017 RepID=UPI001300A2F1|nr:hypothetical protein [Pseudomonas huaxiensis]